MGRARTLRGLVAGVAAAALLAGCASTERLEEQRYLAQTLQLQNDQLEAYLEQLEAENAALQVRVDELELTGGAATPPPVLPADVTLARELEEIQSRIDALDAGDGELAPVAVPGGYGYSVAERVAFDSGSVELRPEGRALLEDLARQIAETEFAVVWVRGHTDGLPVRRAETLERFPHGNLQISAERALEVAATLVAAGLPREAVMVAGFGPTRPIADNTTEEGRRANRRVEIFVLEESEGADARGGL
jgi:flagellar motor protein MotB